MYIVFLFFLTLELGLNQSLPVVNHSPSVIISLYPPMEITPQLMAPIGELNSLIDNDVCNMSDLINIMLLNPQ